MPAYIQNGLSTVYTVRGSGPPLLFISGGGVSAQSYSAPLMALSEYFTVVALDLPGFGSASTPPAVWGIPEYAGYVDSFLDHLNFERIIVVGHSLGGGIALGLSSRRVAGLVLVSPAALPNTSSELSFRFSYFVGKTVYDLVHHPTAIFVLASIGWDFFSNRVRRSHQWHVVLATLRKCVRGGVRGLTHVRVPVYIVAPRSDEIVRFAVLERLKILLPSASLVSVRGNHDWLLFRGRELAEYVRGWFLSH